MGGRVSYFQVLMTGQLIGQVDRLVRSPLWHHHNATDLLHLRVVWWTGAVQVACNLEEPSRERKDNIDEILRR